MENPEQEDTPLAANRAVKLPPFWTANPRAWFTSAEGAFRLSNIADEESRFFNCLHDLPETTVSLIADLVEADPLPTNPYTELRRRLLAAHQLTDIQAYDMVAAVASVSSPEQEGEETTVAAIHPGAGSGQRAGGGGQRGGS
jgi:hypothetical protein